VYNLRAKHQTARVDVRRGVGRTFYIRVQNDGNVPDRILVKGPGSRSGCTARYYFGNVEVTSEIVSGTYRTWLLSPGDRQTLRLRVNVAGDALADAKHSWRVVTSSVHDPLKRDAVKAIVKVV
jgi:hypothetical protein